MARPVFYTDATRFCVHPDGSSKLQAGSDRRKIVDLMLENGGCMTLGEIDAHFGFSVRAKVLALTRIGWLATPKHSDSDDLKRDSQ